MPRAVNDTTHAMRLFFSSDIDECLTDNAGCSHSCTNVPGGYRCSCPDPELTLGADNHTCKGKDS